MALEGLALRGAQKAQEAANRPMIGWSVEETMITPRGDKTLIETERTGFSMTALEAGTLILFGSLGWWIYNDGPQKLGASWTSGLIGASEETKGLLEGLVGLLG